jgi:hypothetical protein
MQRLKLPSGNLPRLTIQLPAVDLCHKVSSAAGRYERGLHEHAPDGVSKQQDCDERLPKLATVYDWPSTPVRFTKSEPIVSQPLLRPSCWKCPSNHSASNRELAILIRMPVRMSQRVLGPQV